MPPLREEREVSRQEKGGILKGGRQGRMGAMRAEERGRSLQSAEVAGEGTVWSGPVPAAVWPETDSLADPCSAWPRTLSPGYAMQDKDSVFQVGITTLKFSS